MIIHAFTTRKGGDMKKSEANRKKIIRKLFGEDRKLIIMSQKHTNVVGIDALVSNKTDVVLSVFVADCAPILLSDGHIIAAIHAGWRGTLGGLTTNTIEEMKKSGSNPKNIIAWIGPHIGMCHYDVSKERVDKFFGMFGNDPKIASFFEDKWHLDIGWANYRQLTDAGVKPKHINAPPTCTACQIDTYFSYRKDSKETFGEIMGVIGWKNV